MELPVVAEAFKNVVWVAVFTGLVTAWLKVFIKRKIEQPGNTQLDGKADVLILGLALLLSTLTSVVAQCVVGWPPTAADLFTAVMTGIVGASLSSFGAKFIASLFAWVQPGG